MKNIIIIFMIILIMIVNTGCWDRKEPESLAIVVGFGFDYDLINKEYIVIAQIVNPLIRQGGGGGQAGPDKPPFWNVSGRGKSIFLALTDMRSKLSRELYYAHTHLELFSTTLLKEIGVIPVLDALERTGQTRPIILMAVTDDDPKEVLNVFLPLESINALGIVKQMEITQRELGGTTVEKARDFLIDISTPGIEASTVMISLNSNNKNIDIEDEPSQDTSPPLRIPGKALFKGVKMITKFNGRETRGCNWIKGEIKTANLDFLYPGSKEKYVSVNSKLNNSSFEAVMTETGPEINLDIDVEGTLVNITGRSDIKNKSKLTMEIEKSMAELIEEDIRMAISKAQKYESDVFGFGNAFYRKKYDNWLGMRDNWDKIFADLKVNIDIKAVITKTGMINKGIESR